MKVRFRWQGRVIIVLMGIFCLGTSGNRALWGQSLPSNPLRTAAPRVVDQSPSIQRTSASEPQGIQERWENPPVSPAAPPRRASQVPYRQVAYGSRPGQRPPMGFVPQHSVLAQTGTPTEMILQSESMGEPGEMVFGELPAAGEILGSDCCDSPGADCDGCGPIDACGGCGSCNGCLIPCPRLTLDNFEIFAGVQGFTAPLNRGETGSFGFHYGANWAVPVPCILNEPLGMQLGYRGVNSNFSGASFSEDSRNQSFLTAGLFRRVDWGVQGGLVIDMLSDEWYYDKLELTQLRGELSWVYPQCHELGFWFSSGLKTNDVQSALLINGRRQPVIEQYEATDLLAFFYRRRFEAIGGGYGRLFGGFTGSSEGLIGADFKLPLTPSLALQSEFTYLVPKDGNNRIAQLEEAWNVGITLVWYPGCRKAVGIDYFRPLFDVADNGDFIVRPVGD